ncbi:MAG TPA: DUF952 domain-containing protein [Pseudonocardia sp.]
MNPIFHIAYARDWQRALLAGSYAVSTRGLSLAEQGYIHASTAEQVASTADRFYAGERDLVVLVIDPARVGVPIRFEPPAPGVAELFPHIYGPLDVAAVVGTRPLVAGPDGRFAFDAG